MAAVAVTVAVAVAITVDAHMIHNVSQADAKVAAPAVVLAGITQDKFEVTHTAVSKIRKNIYKSDV